MENNTTQHDIVMFKINSHIDYIAEASRNDLMECHYSQLIGMLDLARALDIISITEERSIVNEVHDIMASRIVKEDWC